MSHANGNAYAKFNANADSECYAYGDTYGHHNCYADSDANSYSQSNTEASTESPAAPDPTLNDVMYTGSFQVRYHSH